VAIDYLLDQMYSYQENFDVKITKIDGSKQQFKNSCPDQGAADA